MKYSLKCTCGDVMSVDAATKEEAVEKLKGIMTQETIDKHWSEKHPGDSNKPTLEQAHMMIEQNTVEDQTDASQQPVSAAA